MSMCRGFIALASVLIVSAMLLVMLVGSATRTFYARFDQLEAEDRAMSLELARACAADAMLRLRADPAYDGTDAVQITGGSCTIARITHTGGHAVFSTSASYRNAQVGIAITLSDSDLSLVSEEEVPRSAP